MPDPSLCPDCEVAPGEEHDTFCGLCNCNSAHQLNWLKCAWENGKKHKPEIWSGNPVAEVHTSEAVQPISPLAELHRLAAASYAWRTKTGTTITEAQYDATPSVTKEQITAKAKYQWKSDPKLVAKLVAAESAWQPGKPAVESAA